MRAGICTPVCRKVTFRPGVSWLRKLGVGGVVIWPNVFFGREAGDISNWLFRHELEHCYQIIRAGGPFRFYIKYFYYSVRYGYKKNPYELEAHDRQGNQLTHHEETLLWKLNEG